MREAIRRLAREGLVHSAPGEVARVAPISLGGVRALFEFRMILEPAAARRVARDGRFRPEPLRPFHDLLAEFESVRKLVSRGNHPSQDTFYTLTEHFDQELIAVTRSRNDPLAQTITDQRGQTTRLRNVAHSDTGHLADSLDEHLRVCGAIADARPDDAAEELTRHLERTLRTILDTLARGPAHGTEVEAWSAPGARRR